MSQEALGRAIDIFVITVLSLAAAWACSKVGDKEKRCPVCHRTWSALWSTARPCSCAERFRIPA